MLCGYAACRSTLRMFLLLPQRYGSTVYARTAKIPALWNYQSHLMFTVTNLSLCTPRATKKWVGGVCVVHTGEVVVTFQDLPSVLAVMLGYMCL